MVKHGMARYGTSWLGVSSSSIGREKMHFSSDWLNRWLDRRFFTNEDLAERVGVSKNTAYRWAAGKMTPNKHHILKIAEVLGVEKW